MKQSRQRGVYRVDLGKYTADKLALRFDENIGDLRKYLGTTPSSATSTSTTRCTASAR